MNIDTRVSRRDLPVIILVVLVALLGCIYILSGISGKSAQEGRVMGFVCPSTETNLLSMAIEEKDKRYCDCYHDEARVTECGMSVRDTVAYERAVTRLDMELCDEVTNQVRRAACVSVIQQHPDFIGHSTCAVSVCNPSVIGEVAAVDGTAITINPTEYLGEPVSPDEIDEMSIVVPETVVIEYYDAQADVVVEESRDIVVGETIGVALQEGVVEGVVVFTN